jgi:hypothetical protein
MKKIILITLCLFAIKAQSQTIDTTIQNCIAARIETVYYEHQIPTITDTLCYLGVFDYQDNLKGNCTANWVVLSNKKKNIVMKSYNLTEEEYNNWDGSPIGLLSIIGNYLKIKFK